MKPNPANRPRPDALSRREFVGGCAAVAAATMLSPRRAEAAASVICPEELICRSLTGKLEIIGTDGQGHRVLELNRPDIESWGVGPVFADGRRVILTGFGRGTVWKGQANVQHFIYDRATGRISDPMLKAQPAPHTTISFLLPGEERMMIGSLVNGETLLFSCRLDGSELRPVTQPGQGFTYGETLSPDRRRIAFHSVGMSPDAENLYAIFTAHPDGTARTLVDRDEEAYCFGPTWSPDSRWLAYLKCPFKTDPGHDTADLWLARADGSEKHALTAGHPHLFATGFGHPPHYGNGSNLTLWSPTAHAITHSRVSRDAVPPWVWAVNRTDTDHFNRDYRPEQARGGAQLCLVDPFSGKVRALTPATERRWDFRAKWSPAGDKLAFIRADVGGPGQLWVMNADGFGARFLTAGDGDVGVDHPHFLPRAVV
jgi:TolB protein